MRFMVLFALLIFGLSAASALAGTQYSITGMRPAGISMYGVPSRNANREYLHFQNEVGGHRFIYEEIPGTPALASMASLRQVMGSAEMVCQIDLDCRTKAFCTGKCRNMYYEMSNTPDDPAMKDRNHCSVTAFKCQKGAGGVASGGR